MKKSSHLFALFVRIGVFESPFSLLHLSSGRYVDFGGTSVSWCGLGCRWNSSRCLFGWSSGSKSNSRRRILRVIRHSLVDGEDSARAAGLPALRLLLFLKVFSSGKRVPVLRINDNPNCLREDIPDPHAAKGHRSRARIRPVAHWHCHTFESFSTRRSSDQNNMSTRLERSNREGFRNEMQLSCKLEKKTGSVKTYELT